jgi:hypothetical protein
MIATANFVTRYRANIITSKVRIAVWICVVRAASIFNLYTDQNTACAIQHKLFRLARLYPT